MAQKEWKAKWLMAWREALRCYDAFIHIAHGCGDQFISHDDVRLCSVGANEDTVGIDSPLEKNGGGDDSPTRRSLAMDDGEDMAPTSTATPPPRRHGAVCFLAGCSSGKLVAPGDGSSIDAQGMAHACLVAGAPAVIANLWDVTDGEIDRFTDKLFRHIFGGSDSTPTAPADTRSAPPTPGGQEPVYPWSLSDALHAARKRPNLRYLIGCSPVMYGLPISIRQC